MTKSIYELLAEIKERAEAATPGEWKTFDRGFDDAFPTTVDFSRIMAVDGTVVRSCVMVRLGKPDKICMEKADADFVTHARTDIPALLAVIEKLLQQRDSAYVVSWDKDLGGMIEDDNTELVAILTKGIENG